MSKGLRVKLSLILVLAILASMPGWGALPVHAASNVVVDPGISYQTFDGWGISNCWWGNVVGGWPTDKMNEIVDLAYGTPSQNCLGLNIIRHNIGGGDDPSHHHMIIGAQMPGYEPSNGVWDWDADANQRAVFNYALQKNPDLIKVAFSNSPPYWMTNSGCTAGGVNGADNLKSNSYPAFADYLTEVVKHFRDSWGITFDYISPINEPDIAWGSGNVQEGCGYSPENQVKIINEVKSKLTAKGLSTQIMSSEQTNISNFVNQVGSYDAATKANIGVYCSHTYSGTNRTGAYNLAKNDNKKLWMSEVCVWPGPHDATHTEFFSSTQLADKLMADLRDMKPNAWCEWLLAEGEEQAGNVGNVNLIHIPYSNNPDHTYYITKQYYTFGQFTRFIRPGYTFIDTNQGNTVAAWDKTSGNLTIVVKNTGASNADYTFDLTRFATAGASASVYRTSQTENGEQLSNVPVPNKSFTVTAVANSVTTYVIPGMSYVKPGGSFNDNFDDGDLAGWNVVSGSWANTGTGVRGQGNDVWLMRNEAAADFTYEADVKLVSGSGIIRFRSNNDGSAGYALAIEPGDLKLYKFPYVPIRQVDMTNALNTWHHVKIVASGSNLKVYFNGSDTPVIDADDSAYATGYFGLGTYGTAEFDNASASSGIFNDDFSSGTLVGWTPAGGTWTNTGGAAQGITGSNQDGFLMSAVTGDNFTYEADIKLLTQRSAGILTFRSNGNASSSYDVTLDSSSNYIKLYKFPYASIRTYNYTFAVDTWYHLKVEANGTNIKVYFNNSAVPCIEAEDSSYTAGQFGIGSWNGTVQIDNVTVR